MKRKTSKRKKTTRKFTSQKIDLVKEKYKPRFRIVKSVSRPTDIARALRVSVDRVLLALTQQFQGRPFSETQKLDKEQIDHLFLKIHTSTNLVSPSLPVESKPKPQTSSPKKKRKKKKKKRDLARIINTPSGGQPGYRIKWQFK